ncbi:MAG: hypothetical protein ACLFRY_09235 [Spirochaetia bacterium]
MKESAAVERALELIGTELSREVYEIEVSTRRDETYVSFSMPVKYVPLDSAAYYGVTVNITTKTLYYSSLSNPEDSYEGTEALGFFEPCGTDLQDLDFAADAIYREMGFDFRIEKPRDEMVIYERDAHFEVTVISPYQESWYKIDRRTGRLYDDGHAHLIPPPETDAEPIQE